MKLHFIKMEGAGNDYIYMDGFKEQVPKERKPDIVRRLSDRHFGIGGDGIIFINPSKIADFEMEMYNADGSRGEMCGNGIRCVGKYVYDHGMTGEKPGQPGVMREEFSIESFGKIKYLTVTEKDADGKATTLRVNMGSPILEAAEIPVLAEKSPVVDEPITVGGREYRMTCVSMGNPHAVVFTDNVKDLPLAEIGPLFEHHERFPSRTNTEFVEVVSRDYVRMRVWERGSGETLACGTGCCATGVACILNGKTDNAITVEVLGGRIRIEWDRDRNEIWMTGPATSVFEGDVEIGE
jgi:diaminopimelate epimerase